MHEAAGFLQDLAIVMCVAAVTTVLFQRLRQPVVIGYLLAGLIVGPHVPFPLFADLGRVQTLSELGLIVLVFSIGLDFSMGRLLRMGPTSAVAAAVSVGVMLMLGHVAARSLGWDARVSLFAGGMVAVASTMIAARVLEDLAVERRQADFVFGITVVEDLFAMLLVAVLTTVAAGQELSAGGLLLEVAKLIGFLFLLVAFGLLLVPRALSYVARLGSRETTLVASIGTCFAFALIAHFAEYSVALGAFIAGVLCAESGEARRIERLVRPLRDMFGALFFVSIGMLIDPWLLLEYWPAIALFTIVVMLGKVLGIGLGSVLVGRSVETAIRAGTSLAQIGEFSFLLAGVASLKLGAPGAVLPPVAVAVCVVTAFASPYYARFGKRLGPEVDQHLPRQMRTFLTLYATWLEGLGSRPSEQTLKSRMRRTGAWMLADATCIAAVVIAVSLSLPNLETLLQERFGIAPRFIAWIVAGVALVAIVPFAFGVYRCVRRLGELVAGHVLPGRAGLDLAAAPRRAMLAAIQFGLLVLVALPVLAVTLPFVPALPSVGVMLLVLALAFWALWKSATNLEGHVRAGAAVVLEVLAGQSREARPSLDSIHDLLPGLGPLTPVRLAKGDVAVGRTVAEVNLHGHSGATILCISRGSEGTVAPTPDKAFEAGDVLTLAGTAQAIATAREVLAGTRRAAATD